MLRILYGVVRVANHKHSILEGYLTTMKTISITFDNAEQTECAYNEIRGIIRAYGYITVQEVNEIAKTGSDSFTNHYNGWMNENHIKMKGCVLILSAPVPINKGDKSLNHNVAWV